MTGNVIEIFLGLKEKWVFTNCHNGSWHGNHFVEFDRTESYGHTFPEIVRLAKQASGFRIA